MRRLLGLLVLGSACSEETALERLVPRIAVDAEALSFGEVPVGMTRRISLAVSNSGGAPLTIGALTVAAPFHARSGQTVILAGASGWIDVRFSPSAEGALDSELVIASDAEGAPTIRVRLSGTGVDGSMSVTPRQVDLSGTQLGATRSIELTLRNSGFEARSGRVLPARFARPDAFALGGVNLTVERVLTIAAGATHSTVLSYFPTVRGDDSGAVLLELCGLDCGLEVEVIADAIFGALRAEPASVAFGPVGIDRTKTELVTLHNDGSIPLDVLRLRTLGSAGTEVTSARPLPATLEPGASMVVRVSYTPSEIGPMVGQLVIDTSDDEASEARVRIGGEGAGPKLEVHPEVVDFGVVRSVALQRRHVVMVNAGSAEVRIDALDYSGHASLRLGAMPGLPIRLGPGETLTANVELVPTGTVGRFLGEITVRTDSLAELRVPVRAAFSDTACQLDVAPNPLVFGMVTPPHSRELGVRLVNRGERPCALLRGDFAAPIDPAFRLGQVAWPIVLEPRQSATLTFMYAPAVARESKSTFWIVTDDAAFPNRPIQLTASSLGYDDIFVAPAHFDFGETQAGCVARTRSTRVFNVGTVDVIVEAARLSSAAIRAIGAALPATIPAGGSLELVYEFAPQAVGQDAGEIAIEVRGHALPIIVSWTGGVGPQMRVTDESRQSVPGDAVDVMFVVDDSCSMEDEQTALATNFGAFIQAGTVLGADFRMLVTTTDVEGANAGALRGAVMSPTTPGLEAEFRRQVNVGTLGSGLEQGLEAMSAVTRRHRGAIDFFRPNTRQLVIVVSDEDDSSPGAIAGYAAALGPNGTFAAVTGGDRGCFRGSNFTQRAPRYAAFVAMTAGTSLSICADWATTLSDLGAVAFGLHRSFALSALPLAPSIEVRVDGAPAAGWTYDAGSNRVEFGAAPPPGSRVQISYLPGC